MPTPVQAPIPAQMLPLSSADVAWLTAEGAMLTKLANALSWVPNAVSEAKADETTANSQSLQPPSAVLQQIANAVSSDQLAQDANKVAALAPQVQAVLSTVGQQAQQIATLQKQLTAAGIKPAAPGAPPSNVPAASSGMSSTALLVMGGLTVAAIGAGAWWMLKGKSRASSSARRARA